MNSILFFLTPKAMCAYLYDDYTIRQALEKMESAGYAAIPILNRRGEYRGTLTEGDLLWAMKNMCYMDMRQAEARRIMEISRRKDNLPVRVTASMHDLVERASMQNFVPVVDDYGAFIGIITRKAIIKYWKALLRSGGALLFEVGEGQAEPVKEMLLAGGFRSVSTRLDTLGVERVVIGIM